MAKKKTDSERRADALAELQTLETSESVRARISSIISAKTGREIPTRGEVRELVGLELLTTDHLRAISYGVHSAMFRGKLEKRAEWREVPSHSDATCPDMATCKTLHRGRIVSSGGVGIALSDRSADVPASGEKSGVGNQKFAGVDPISVEASAVALVAELIGKNAPNKKGQTPRDTYLNDLGRMEALGRFMARRVASHSGSGHGARIGGMATTERQQGTSEWSFWQTASGRDVQRATDRPKTLADAKYLPGRPDTYSHEELANLALDMGADAKDVLALRLAVANADVATRHVSRPARGVVFVGWSDVADALGVATTTARKMVRRAIDRAEKSPYAQNVGSGREVAREVAPELPRTYGSSQVEVRRAHVPTNSASHLPLATERAEAKTEARRFALLDRRAAWLGVFAKMEDDMARARVEARLVAIDKELATI